ncbi:MAG: hypothetical protein ACRDTK_00995 [Mycobacterium sp.]
MGIALAETMTRLIDDGQRLFLEVSDGATPDSAAWHDEAAQPAQQGPDFGHETTTQISDRFELIDLRAWPRYRSRRDLNWTTNDRVADANLTTVPTNISERNYGTFASDLSEV